MSKPSPNPTLDPDEVNRFGLLADQFWDPNGPMRPLHKLNPVRLQYIRDILTHEPADIQNGVSALEPLSGCRLLDVGCGPGLVSEPLTRMGCEVTGIDPSERNIEVARVHAREMGLKIDYRAVDTEKLIADEEGRFDAVTCLEVIEHSPDPERLVGDLGELVRPGGIVVLSTLNRTIPSFAKAIVAAEYLLGWLPRGTHNWQRFLAPSEIARMMRASGMRVLDISGFSYDARKDSFELSQDRSVNYIMTAIKSL